MPLGSKFEDYTYVPKRGGSNPLSRDINIIDNGIVIKTLRSCRDVADYLGSTKGSVKMAVRHGSLHNKRYILKYAN